MRSMGVVEGKRSAILRPDWWPTVLSKDVDGRAGMTSQEGTTGQSGMVAGTKPLRYASSKETI